MVKLVVNNSDAFNTCTITTACLEKPDPTTFWNNYIKTDRQSISDVWHRGSLFTFLLIVCKKA